MDEALHLPNVEPSARLRAESEAARCKIDLADYLEQVLLRQLAAEPTAPDYGLADQVGVLEQIVAQQAEIVTDALGKVDSGLAALCGRLAETERATAIFIRDQSAAAGALRHALASDFEELVGRVECKLAAGLDDTRAQADREARAAEKAAARLLSDLEAMRGAIEARLSESERETRERMHAEFSQITARLDALTEWTHAIESESHGFVRDAVEKVRLETERIEACTLASVEKLARDISSQRTDHSAALLQCEGLDRRLARLETAAETVVTQQALAVVLGELEALRANIACAQPELVLASSPALHAIEQRIENMEKAQSEALETLRIQVALFVDANDRRLCALEAIAPISDDLEAELGALRTAMAERIETVERQCARSLEQVASAMAALSRVDKNRDAA